jgi:putative oxidoreductase
MIPETDFLTDYALLLLRILVAVIFFSSGKSHVLNPKERGKSIGMPPTATSFLGITEILGAISMAAGIFPQIGALILILIMSGAIYKKIFEWDTGFYEAEGFG